MNIEKFDFDLPQKLIAKVPSKERSLSRLLVVGKKLIDKRFDQIMDHLCEEDLLVINNTKVFNARINAERDTGGKVEILIERKLDRFNALALTKSNRPLKLNDKIYIGSVYATLVSKRDYLSVLNFSESIDEVIKNKGSIPIPPYLNRDPLPMDDERYQTVYAEESKMSSTAAPTAGLHFDSTLMERIKEKGIEIAPITLDIGLGTFKPIKDSDFSKHQMHSERINLSKESSELIKSKLNSKGRIISVGTTSLRCLESIFQKFGEIRPFEGETDIFIYPGFKFNVIDALITNFHLPKSTLMLLVSAFAGESTINKAYEHAISNEYRFFSYGDAMFLNRS